MSLFSYGSRILYFGAAAVFTFANWMEDVFSVNVESKENEDRRPAGGDADENEPDGPSEEDRGKAFVVHLRKSLLEGGHNGKWFLNASNYFFNSENSQNKIYWNQGPDYRSRKKTLAVSDYNIELKTIPKFKTTDKHFTIPCFGWLVDWLTFSQRKVFHGENWNSLSAFGNDSI